MSCKELEKNCLKIETKKKDVVNFFCLCLDFVKI